LSEDSSIAAECEWLHFKHAVIKLKDQNQGIPPFDLFSTIISQQESLHLTSISKVLKIMLDISPSNAHIERILFAMQGIKTEMRSGMSQHSLNNLFRVAHNSVNAHAFKVSMRTSI
jgi:hypothetical protein